MNVLSLFDGMSCGQIALDRLGVSVTNYYASEIDKWAIQVTQKNYPNTIQLGSVTDYQDWNIDWSSIDLVSGGFPCQAWSLAGKQLGDRDERGALFWTMLDIIKLVLEHNPSAKFLMENVKMKKEFEQYITQHTENALGKVNKHLINSALVSAQNRQRYYWTNIEGIGQPEDKGIVLRDVLEDGEVDRDKSHCLDANYFKGGNLKSYFEKHRRQLVFSSGLILAGHAHLKGHDSIKRVYSEEGKAPTLTTMGGGHRELKAFVEPKCARIVGRKINPETGKRDDYNPNIEIKQRIEPRADSKTGTLTTVQKDNIILDRNHWRKLTPLECERLQTVPEGYTEGVSNTQRYKMLGNGWTVDVICYIYKHMFEEVTKPLQVQQSPQQFGLFE
jgi:DNA-cytosine methyltransferase